jgi:hypothetical protein
MKVFSLAVPLALLLGAAPETTLKIQGVVRDSRGKAVEGALVLASPLARSISIPSVPVTTRTDGSGRFELPLKAVGPHTLRAEAAGLAAQTLKKVEPGAHLTITLSAGRSLEGIIRNSATREPIAGARVEAREIGGFELPGVQPGSYNVWVRHADFAPAVVPEVRVAAEAETEVNAVLHRGVRVVGRLLDADERPLRGRVTLQELSGEPVSRLSSTCW